MCGNGRRDPGEFCDIAIPSGTDACPTACDDQNPCTMDQLTGTACQARCVQSPIANCVAADRCQSVQPLALTTAGNSATTSVRADTAAAGDDTALTCAPGAGRDHVYSFQPPPGTNVIAVLNGLTSDGGFRAGAVALRSDCPGPDLVCGSAAIGGSVARLPRVDGGTMFVWVDGRNGSEGPYDLQISASPAAPASSACATPRSLAFRQMSDGRLTAYDSDTTVNAAAHASSPACLTSPTANDVVYELSTTQPWDVTASAFTSTAGFEPVVYLRPTCMAPDLACARETSTSPASFTLGSVPAGNYRLVVDGYQGNGDYTLVVTLRAPRATPSGESCASAIPLIFDGGVARHDLDTFLVSNDDYNPGCVSPTGRDAVFMLNVPNAGTVRASVRALGSRSPVMYLRRTCNVNGGELACARGPSDGGFATLQQAVTAGTYFLVLDFEALGATGGVYWRDLTVTLQ